MSITRDSVEGLRWYTDGDSKALSVTQVLSLALEEDQTGLDIWKGRNDGDNGNPWWEHLFWYAGRRGTLCHYQALVHFEDHFDGDELWGEEETRAIKEVSRGPPQSAFEGMSDRWERVPTDLDEITYSVLKNKGVVDSREQYDVLFSNVSLIDVLVDDIDFFYDKFSELRDALGLNNDSVIAVEKYLLNSDPPFGGQTDLVYEDPEGDIVVADLKTSSGLRHKHRLQAVAYARAVENADDIEVDEVDRVEVWRISTDSKEVAVHTDKVPAHLEDVDAVTDENWLKDSWGEFEYDDSEDMWTTFKELSREAHDHA